MIERIDAGDFLDVAQHRLDLASRANDFVFQRLVEHHGHVLLGDHVTAGGSHAATHGERLSALSLRRSFEFVGRKKLRPWSTGKWLCQALNEGDIASAQLVERNFNNLGIVSALQVYDAVDHLKQLSIDAKLL